MTLRFASIKATTLLNLKAAQQRFERDPTSANWLVTTAWMAAWQQLHHLSWDKGDEEAKRETLRARLTVEPEYLWPEVIVEVSVGLTLSQFRRFG